MASRLTECSEHELLSAAIDGNEEALGLLLFRQRVTLIGAIRPQLGARLQQTVSEEDALQETYRQAFLGFARADFLEGDVASLDAFTGWLRRVASNTVKQLGREAAAKKRGGEFARFEPGGDLHQQARDLMTELSTGDETVSQFVAKSEALDALRVALAGLSDDQQRAVRLRYFEQLSVEDVAEQMAKTTGAVRGLLDRARAALRTAMHHSALWFSRRG
ncbi:MAG: sigma-70 family RNA polymerase sigma factor [Planctomycetota bacterium]